MQHVSEGIKIFFNSPESLTKENRVFLSSGTYQLLQSSQNDIMHCPDAFLPKEPWKEASEADLNILLASSQELNPSRCVTIFRVPDNAFVRLEKMGLSSVSTIEDHQAIQRHAHYQKAIEPILEHIQPLLRSTGGLVVHSIGSNPPGLNTVTYDWKRGCYIGLHLDSWDQFPLKERDKSRNRICINMGHEDRYLLFINLTLMDIFQKLYENMDPDHFQQGHGEGRIGETFMRNNPSYPVVKLRIAPHEAYIAPTENMIHDGSTMGQSNLDLCLHIRGFFANSMENFSHTRL